MKTNVFSFDNYNSHRVACLLLTLIVSVSTAGIPAKAQLVITPTYTNAVLTNPNATAIESTINAAIQMYETTYTNAVNVSITFDNTSVGLGQSSTYYNDVPYSDYVSHLRGAKPGSPLLTYVPNTDPVSSANQIAANLPDLRAIGYTGSLYATPFGDTDSTVSINFGATNITRTGMQDPTRYDLLAVTEHEIDQVLGTTSALDGLNSGDPSPTDAIGPMDLYRFSGVNTRSFTTLNTATSYFSVDNGSTPIVGFNQTGGANYSDWVKSGTVRVQDAYGTPGAQPNFGFAESTALQAVGYNLAAPEPSPLVAFGLGIAGLAALIFTAKQRIRNYTS